MYVLSRPRGRVAGYVDRGLGEGRQSDAKARGEAKSVRPKLDFSGCSACRHISQAPKNTPPVRAGRMARGLLGGCDARLFGCWHVRLAESSCRRAPKVPSAPCQPQDHIAVTLAGSAWPIWTGRPTPSPCVCSTQTGTRFNRRSRATRGINGLLSGRRSRGSPLGARGIGFVAVGLDGPLKVSRHSLQACRHWAVGAE